MQNLHSRRTKNKESASINSGLISNSKRRPVDQSAGGVLGIQRRFPQWRGLIADPSGTSCAVRNLTVIRPSAVTLFQSPKHSVQHFGPLAIWTFRSRMWAVFLNWPFPIRLHFVFHFVFPPRIPPDCSQSDVFSILDGNLKGQGNS